MPGDGRWGETGIVFIAEDPDLDRDSARIGRPSATAKGSSSRILLASTEPKTQSPGAVHAARSCLSGWAQYPSSTTLRGSGNAKRAASRMAA
jgi:hypothetical protein